LQGAISDLIEACKTGKINLFGNYQGNGESEQITIPPRPSFQIRDHEKRGVIAAIANGPHKGGRWWNGLQFRVRDVQRLFPFPRRRRTDHIWGYRFNTDDRPDPIADPIWARRRQRLAESQSATVEPARAIGADGLPTRAEITLTEAWSWCAFGKAVPPNVWVDDELLRHADERYTRARLELAKEKRWTLYHSKGANKLDMETALFDVLESPIYRPTKNSLQEAQFEMDHALADFATQIARWRFVKHVLEGTRKQRNVEADEKSFAKRAGDEAAEALFSAFLEGILDCMGRLEASEQWEVLPKDCFRFPVQIRPNCNRLEPAEEASVDEHRLIMQSAAQWRDLRVNTAALCAWWSSRRSADNARQPGQVAPPLPADRSQEQIVKKKARQKASQKEMDAWYLEYRDRCLVKSLSPNVHEDEDAAREKFTVRFDREKLRKSRRRLACDAWSSPQKAKSKRKGQ
jgi:hypothetical protein